MPTFRITALYEYEGEIEAANEDEARRKFWSDLNSHYVSTEDEKIVEIEICEDCEYEVERCQCDSDDDGDSDTADSEWLASAGFGTDEDYE